MGHITRAQKAIEQQFASVWGETTVVKYKNDKTANERGQEYVTVAILEGGGEIVSLSSPPRRRYFGFVAVRVFTPEGQGSARCNELLELAESAFYTDDGVGRQLAITNGLISFNGVAEKEEAGTAGGLYMTLLRCSFFRDQQGA